LIDVAVGSMLLAVLLIPSVHMMGKSKSSNHRLAIRDALVFEADQLLENVKIALADNSAFDAAVLVPTDRSTPMAISDVPHAMSRVRVSTDPSVAPSPLLTIIVAVWQDTDRDGNFDSGEPAESLRTQWASP
jgi:hypothetical protein